MILLNEADQDDAGIRVFLPSRRFQISPTPLSRVFIYSSMATGAKQSKSQAKPLLGLKQHEPVLLSPQQKSISPSPTPSSSVDSFMTARTSATPTLASSTIASSRLSSTPSPPTPPSPSPASFIQEIDVFMENIGRLVRALEDQHKQRQFDIGRPRDANADAVEDPRHNTLDLGGPFRVSGLSLAGSGAGSTSTSTK
ncbi:hypothetical protein MVEN_02532200 [Mycena venus]|uniref:Uncharacterized protein n=1 Tax=Mycena venus TaxID=2733690 RepID=A0A8H7C9K6_9AGAR|nr:hypothetical protein MVEN_02532200 [Mycena venus]